MVCGSCLSLVWLLLVNFGCQLIGSAFEAKIENTLSPPFTCPGTVAQGDHIPVEIKEGGKPTTPEEEIVEKEEAITMEEEPNAPSKPAIGGYKSAGVT